MRLLKGIFRFLTSPVWLIYRGIKKLLLGLRFGAAGILALGGFLGASAIDLIAIYRCFTEHSFLMGLFALTPIGWVIAPFVTGLAGQFIGCFAASTIGYLLVPKKYKD